MTLTRIKYKKDIVLIKDDFIAIERSKIKYLNKLNGRTMILLNEILGQLVTYNSNKIIITKDFRLYMEKYYNFSNPFLSSNIKLLIDNGILAKIAHLTFLYNPHIFKFADNIILRQMRENFICEFDDKNLEIKVNFVKLYNNTKLHLNK